MAGIRCTDDPGAAGTGEVPPPDRDLFPLMCGQRWLVHLWENSPGFARPVQRIYRLRQRTDTSALLAAFRQVVTSNPALRMGLVRTAEGWCQRFPELEAEITGLRIFGKTQQHRAAYARHVLAEDSSQAFDLQHQHAFLARVIDVDGDMYWSLCLDHIAADDLATDILEREITLAYRRLTLNQPLLASHGATAFFDCLARETAKSSLEPANLAHWRGKLRGVRLSPQSRAEPDWVSGSVGRWSLLEDASEAVVTASKRYRCSVFALVLAAQLCLVSELEGSDDVVLNIPVSNRTHIEDYRVVANLSMLLHVRFKVDAHQTPGEFIAGVRSTIMEAMTHRHFDYSALHAAIARDTAARGGEVHWLTGCSFINERDTLPEGEILFEERLDNQRTGNFDTLQGSFSLGCRQRGSGIYFEAEWDSRKWPIAADTMGGEFLRMLGRFL